MKRSVAMIAAIVLGGAAHAQVRLPYAVETGRGFSNNQQFNLRNESRMFESSSDTPTMKRARLQRILSLKADVDRFLAEGGGMLSPQRQSYVRRRYAEIMKS